MSIVRTKRAVGAPKKKASAAPTATTTKAARGPVEPRALALDVPFAMRGVAAACGARWSADRGVFVFRGAELPAGLAPFAPTPYSWEAHVQRELDDEAGFTPRQRRSALRAGSCPDRTRSRR